MKGSEAMQINKKSLLTAVIMSAVFAIMAVISPVTASADMVEMNTMKNSEKITPTLLDDARDIENIEPVYSMKDLILEENEDFKDFRYLSFDLPEDSWVYLGGGFSHNNHDGAQAHVSIYSNSSYTRRVGEFGWGYWETEHIFSGFLAKGSYYIEMKAKQANNGDYTGNVDLYAARIPISKVFAVTQKTASNKKSVRVTLKNRLAGYMDYVQYKRGKIGTSRMNSHDTWVYKYSGFFMNPEAATLVKNKDDIYSFTVKKNGKYTILITDASGYRHQKVINVKGIKNKNTKKRK